jgi:hypothetical protein
MDKEIGECYICLDKLEGELVEINCSHIYHYKCVKEWLDSKRKLNRPCCICDKETEIINIFYNMSKPIKNIVSYQNIINESYHQPIRNHQQEEIRIKWCCNIL